MSSGGGSKTTTQVTKNEVPEYIESAGKKAEAMADYVSQLGYVPNYGLDVAGFSPLQSQAFQNAANAGSAFFGTPMMDANAYMPQTKTDNLGFTGYSSGDLYDQSVAALQQRAPAQYDAITDMFIDPQAGGVGVTFQPSGSIGLKDTDNPLASYNLNDYVSSGGDALVTNPSKSEWEMLMDANNFNQSVKDYSVVAPGGLLAKLGSVLNQGFVINPYLAERNLALKQYENGGQSSTGDYGYVSGNYGGNTITYGTADSSGRNSAGHTAGGTGRSDGGYGW